MIEDCLGNLVQDHKTTWLTYTRLKISSKIEILALKVFTHEFEAATNNNKAKRSERNDGGGDEVAD